MPYYEFKCDTCGKETLKFLKMKERNNELDCACGEGKLLRIISTTSFKFTGSGFYKTDYKDKK